MYPFGVPKNGENIYNPFSLPLEMESNSPGEGKKGGFDILLLPALLISPSAVCLG